jgi:hypothetical protein
MGSKAKATATVWEVRQTLVLGFGGLGRVFRVRLGGVGHLGLVF